MKNARRSTSGLALSVFAMAMGLAALGGCGARAVAPGQPVDDALASRVVWTPAEQSDVAAFDGSNAVAYDVVPGQVVRIATDSAIDVGEEQRSAGVTAQVWSKMAPTPGTDPHAILLRPSPFTHRILVHRGAAGRVDTGAGSDPGYAWYTLEDDVLAWSEAPFGTPFPRIAPAERVDYDALRQIGQALGQAVAAAPSNKRDDAADDAHAVLRVVGLRVAHTLRPVSGFPYFFDSPIDVQSAKPVVDHDRAGFELSPGHPGTVEIEGPFLLHIWGRGLRADADEAASLRVYEGTRLRAESGSSVARRILVHTEPGIIEQVDEEVSIRRAVVQVPPGKHTYRIEADGGTLRISAMLSKPVLHLEDAITGAKSERGALETARRGCDANAATICAMALALAGDDDDTNSSFVQSKANAPADARPLIDELASGGPHDPSLALELRASRGDVAALGKLEEAARSDVDEGVRSAWARAMVRGTRWTVPASFKESATWTTVLSDNADTPGCSGQGAWPEITSETRALPARKYRDAYVLELLAQVGCEGGEPVTLEVDGEKLTAQPSSAASSWHVIVRGHEAKVRRTDHGAGHLYAVPVEQISDAAHAAECTPHWGHVRGPLALDGGPTLKFDTGASGSAGIEVWMKDGIEHGDVFVRSTSSATDTARIEVHREKESSVFALDASGQKWVRAARVALPSWVSTGASFQGVGGLAVRPLVRAARDATTAPEEEKDALPLDETALADLSHRILAAQAPARASLYMQRAELLAEGGASQGALEDAAAARALGGKGPHGEDTVTYIQTRVRKHRTSLALISSAAARGVEPDFRAGAPRCGAATAGAHGKIETMLAELKAMPQDRSWDVHVALKALEAAEETPNDPRVPALTSRALAGSEWKLVKKYDAKANKVLRPRAPKVDSAIDAGGELRPRVVTGAPFGANFANITPQRPAKFSVGSSAGTGGAHARIDYLCVPRAPADALGAACPLTATFGEKGASEGMPVRADGSGTLRVPDLPHGSTHVTLSMKPVPGRWAALARVVFDREVPGTVDVPGTGWVLAPSGEQSRVLLSNGERTAVELDSPAIVRIEALAEPGPAATLTALVDGITHPVPTDGSALVLPLPHAGSVVVSATGGSVTLTIAERQPREEEDAPQDIDAEAPEESAALDTEKATTAGGVPITLDTPNAPWRDVTLHSPAPMSPFSSDLGTFEFYTSAEYGTLREGDRASKAPDGYFSEEIGYRRRIETLNLTTDLEGFGHFRDGQPTYGGTFTFYEDADKYHLRFTGTVDYDTQLVEGTQIHTFNPRGFLEYSWRATRSFFILPRLGYDGYYTTLKNVPKNLDDVDDAVFNEYRFVRDTFVFLQALFWYTPYFNDIFYLRPRITYDARAGEFAHAAIRPGAFLDFGQFDINAYVDAAWYKATGDAQTGVVHDSSVDVEGGITLEYNIWGGFGSVDVVPGVSAYARLNDGGWQAFAFINVYLSRHRGLRDFSSLELDFPEQLADRIPWRGSTIGGGP